MLEKRSLMAREFMTVKAMIRIYCNDTHESANDICEDCTELIVYAGKRLNKCPYAQEKPTCANCPIHCYKPDMRVKIREVMRYAGPRMIYRHPGMAIMHIIDGRKKAPEGFLDSGRKMKHRV